MKSPLIFAMVALFACLAQAQTLITDHVNFKNHGGHALLVGVGADQTDEVTLDVVCNRPIDKLCFAEAPTLDSTPFTLLYGSNNGDVQHWAASAAFTGDHVVGGNYPELGVNVHYDILILSAEALHGIP